MVGLNRHAERQVLRKVKLSNLAISDNGWMNQAAIFPPSSIFLNSGAAKMISCMTRMAC